MHVRPTSRLTSWKAIAAYLGRSVRTVRRWERHEGLPVHRQLHRKLGRVFAVQAELDAWKESRSLRPARVHAPNAVAAPPRSVAVLPFSALEAASARLLAEGVTDELTVALARVGALEVVSRRSAALCGHYVGDTRAIAARLGVRYLVEGSVQRSGARMRISARLVDARRDVHCWAETFDGAIEDVFSIQDLIARRVVDALAVRLTDDESRRIREPAIESVPAYECYLRARHEMWAWRNDAIDRAVQLLTDALAMIGDHARLYAALGLAHLQYREAGIDLSDRPLAAADACCSKLLSLDPRSASGLQLRAWIAYSRGRIRAAVDDLTAAAEQEPNNADTLLLLCNCYLISGRVAAARPLLARLLRIDPLTPITRCMPGFAAIMDGHPDAALEPYRQMFDMDPSNPMARLFLTWVLILNERHDDIAVLLRTLPPDQRGSLPGRLIRFLARAAFGQPREAREALTSEIETVARATDVFPRFLAQGFALIGDKDAALTWLGLAVDRGFVNYPFLAHHDPIFARWQAEPAYSTLLETVRRRWEAFDA